MVEAVDEAYGRHGEKAEEKNIKNVHKATRYRYEEGWRQYGKQAL